MLVFLSYPFPVLFHNDHQINYSKTLGGTFPPLAFYDFAPIFVTTLAEKKRQRSLAKTFAECHYSSSQNIFQRICCISYKQNSIYFLATVTLTNQSFSSFSRVRPQVWSFSNWIIDESNTYIFPISIMLINRQRLHSETFSWLQIVCSWSVAHYLDWLGQEVGYS